MHIASHSLIGVSAPADIPARSIFSTVSRCRTRGGVSGLSVATGLLALALAGCGGGGAGAPAPSASAPAPVEAPAAPTPAPAPAPVVGTPAPGTGQTADVALVREAQSQTSAFLSETEKLRADAPVNSGRAGFLDYQLKSARALQVELQAPVDQAQAVAAAARIAAMKLDTQLWLEAERRIAGQTVWTSRDLAAVADVVRRFDIWGIAQLPAASESREFSVGEVSSMSAALRMAADSAKQGTVDAAALRAALAALQPTLLAQPAAFVAPPVVDKPPLRIVSDIASMNAASDAPHPSANVVVAPPSPSPSPSPSPGTPPAGNVFDSVRISITAKPAAISFPPGTPAFTDTSKVPDAGLLTQSDIETISNTINTWRLTPSVSCPQAFVSGELPALPYDWRLANGAAAHTMDMIVNQYVAGFNPASTSRTSTNMVQAGFPVQLFVNMALAGPADVPAFLAYLKSNATACSQLMDTSLEAFGVDSRSNSDGRRHWTFSMGRSWGAPAP
ncbi:MAG: hypothetical protein KA169_01000 [Burkholderiaceae bacterium]|jgi:uncharacterized protein YkwD|nr:hypothetical protein [Burkholderiaceae bacterium]